MRWIFALALILPSLSTVADDSLTNVLPKDDMACERAPVASIVGETHSKTSNECNASAKIQAMAYECGVLANTDRFERKSLEETIELAREKCDDFCKDLGDCKGEFITPTDCGLKTSPQMSVDFGKDVIHCPKHCKGTAFNYCSLYHGSFFSLSNRSLFKDFKDNCKCAKRS